MKSILKLAFLKKNIFLFLLMFTTYTSKATDWYASPTGNGNGTLANPFNLQTALNNTASILAGDKLFLRQGIYKGRFICNLVGTSSNKITVTSYSGENVVLDGNILPSNSTDEQVLKVLGANVIFSDFEVTYSNIVRADTTNNYRYCGGISHNDGEGCEFINLIIHDNPGTGFNSWKETASTLIYGCMIYNNGILKPNDSQRVMHGPGLYVQNRSNKYRILKNNIVFNNFWVGFEVWSSSTSVEFPFIQNITLDDNTSFNNGNPYAPYGTHNILVKSADNSGVNIVRNINVINNTLYHNTDYTKNGNSNEAESLEIGNTNSTIPSVNIIATNNFISGRNNLLKFGMIKTITFSNNRVLGRYVQVRKENNINSTDWKFSNNTYYTYNDIGNPQNLTPNKVFRMEVPAPTVDRTLVQWQTDFGIDLNSSWKSFVLQYNSPADNPPNVLMLTQNIYKPNRFKVVLSATPGNPNVVVDFTSYGIPTGTTYTIKDVESFPIISSSGTLPSNSQISFNLNQTSPPFSTPLGLDFSYTPTLSQFLNQTVRTPDNFGVFIVEFANFSGCTANKTITTEVISGNTNYQQASNSITASNIINPDAIGIYHAGSSVILSNGFLSKSSSAFRAYVESCSNTYIARKSNLSSTEISAFTSSNDLPSDESKIIMYPNPTDSNITISSQRYNIDELSVISLDGKEIFRNKSINSSSYELNSSNFSKGIYIVNIKTSSGNMFQRKLIKK